MLVYPYGSGGSGGGSISRTLLFSNNWSTTQPSTITLSDSALNYDHLEVTLLRLASNDATVATHSVPGTGLAYLLSTEISGLSPLIVIPFYDNEWVGYSITSATQWTRSGGNGTLVVEEVYGVNY